MSEDRLVEVEVLFNGRVTTVQLFESEARAQGLLKPAKKATKKPSKPAPKNKAREAKAK
ncbi:MAG: hypothetical protein WAS05_00775 [Candidatus Nanopelagicales bacterium]